MVVDQHAGKGPGAFFMKVGVCKRNPPGAGGRIATLIRKRCYPIDRGM
jgi:hypothetical protein